MLRLEVQKFAEEMEKQLKVNEHKGHWGDCDEGFLYAEMLNNAHILGNAMSAGFKGNRNEVVKRRCANIANFAMMIADNWGRGEGE